MIRPDEPPPAEALAALFIADLADGLDVDPTVYASRLPDDDSRRAFLEIVRDSEDLSGLLPVQVRPGVVLTGRYRILREVGSGGMGKVFEAHDQQLERRVAVKVLAAFGSGRFDPEELFHREARLLARLSHPHIVAVHEVASDGDVHFIVMDLVEGLPLDKVLAAAGADGQRPQHAADLTRALPDGTAAGALQGSWYQGVASLALALARTVEAAHGAELMHRDIKPQNIMLRPDGTPALLDFGLAGAAQGGGGAGAVTQGLFGSVAYLAPEQALTGEVGLDPRTDVYQLGAVLYELLTLQRAYPGSGITEILRRITVGSFVSPRSLERAIPFELEAICLRAMETNPRDRYQSVAELADDLERFVTGASLPLAARAGRLGTAWRSLRYAARRRQAALLTALVASAAVVALMLVFGPDGAPADESVEFFRVTGDGSAIPHVSSGGDQLYTDLGGPGHDVRVLPARGPDLRARPLDLLGARLSTPEPVVVYALSVWGQRDPPEFVAPMDIQAVRPEGSDPVELSLAGRWGLRAGAGDVQLVCAEVSPVEPLPPYEGLWLFTAREPLPVLEDWFDRLRTLGDASPHAAASLDQAREALQAARTGDTLRGRAVSPDDARLAALGERIQMADLLDLDAEWPHDEPRLHRVFFAVDP